MFECKKCQEYNPFSPRANRLGMETFWRAYDPETGQYALGNTKTEALLELKAKLTKKSKNK
ncbi:MAG: hypothetical protein RR405_03460 [Clostridia bacterium]